MSSKARWSTSSTLGTSSGRPDYFKILTETKSFPIRDVGRVHVAVLRTAAADLPVHPIHVLGEPVARHERHALLQLSKHVVHLMVWVHAHHDLTPLLAQCRRESEVASVHVEALRECEGLVAVDGGACTRVEVAGVGLDFGVAPLVARPIWVRAVVVGASMVGDLLHSLVALIHVELMAASQALETLSVAIPVSVLADRVPRHADQIEVQIATARWAVAFEINIYAECLPWEDRHVEILPVAVISGRRLHEVEAIRWRVLDGPSPINRRGAWEVIGVVHPILIDH